MRNASPVVVPPRSYADSTEPVESPQQLARRVRRARLLARFARRRLRYQVLHVALGLAGWGMLIGGGMAVARAFD